jgi:hypothetical protein
MGIRNISTWYAWQGSNLRLDKNYLPFPTDEGDEIHPNGIFHFNITRIMEYIMAGKLDVEKNGLMSGNGLRHIFVVL